jgi:soluble lytic murein transglycosylase-like protein
VFFIAFLGVKIQEIGFLGIFNIQVLWLNNTMEKFAINLTFALLATAYVHVAKADVYGYADESGAVYLTDNPEGQNYELLAVAPVEPVKVTVDEAQQTTIANTDKELGLQYKEEVKVAAQDSGVETALLHAVITVESNYNSKAVSPKGARGLMQLMPFTARRFGVNNAYDPSQNIKGGARYLAYLLKLFKNDFSLAIAAYNAGEDAVIQHGNQIPPYRETVNYVTKVMQVYKKLHSA